MDVASHATVSSSSILRRLGDFFLVAAVIGWIIFSTTFLAELRAPNELRILIIIVSVVLVGWVVLVQRRKRSEPKWRIGDAAHPRLVRAAQVMSLAIQLGFILWVMVPPILRTERIDELHAPSFAHNEVGLVIVGVLLVLAVVFRWTWEVREHR